MPNNEQIVIEYGDSGLVLPIYDEKIIVYSSPAQGELDYISYLLLSVEVFRETFTYDVQGNITNITT